MMKFNSWVKVLALLMFVVSGARAQTNFFWTNNTSGTWSTAGKWDPAAPAPGGSNDYVITFNTNTTLVTTNNLGNPNFVLNQLIIQTGVVTVFSGTGTGLVFNADSTGVLPRFVQNGVSNVALNTAITLGTNTTFTGSGVGTVTVGGVISGAGALTKSGSYTLLLTAIPTYTGSTIVSNGRMTVSNNANGQTIFNSTNITIVSGATFEFNVTGNTMYYRRTGTNNMIAGSGTLLKTGAGTLQVSGNGIGTTFAMDAGGLIDVQGGTLRNGDYSTSIWTSNKASLNIAAGASLDVWDGSAIYVDALTGGGTIYSGNNNGARGITLGVAGGSGVYTGNITAPLLFITKTGTGTQALAGTNTYTGATTISNGVLVLASPFAAQYSSVNNTIAGGLVFSNGQNFTVGSLAGLPLVMTNNLGQAINLGVGGTNTTSTIAINLSDAGQNSTLIKVGTGTLTLTGTNTYGGGTVINNGILQINNTNAVPSLYSVTINSGGVLAATGVYTTVTDWLNSRYIATNSFGVIGLMANSAENIALGAYGNLSLGAIGTVFYGGTITPAAGNYRLGSWGTLILTNDLALTGGNSLIVGGPASGIVVLNGSNTFTGGTVLNGNTLSIVREANIGGSGASLTVNGGTLQIRGTTVTDFANLNVFLTTNLVGAFTLDINSPVNTFSLPLPFTTSLDLVKAGLGTLIMSASNAISGAFTVNAGVLNVQHNKALGTASVTVNSGAALQLQGGLTVANPITLNGTGIANNGALRSMTDGNVLAGVVTLGNTTARINSETGTLTFSGAFNGNNSKIVYLDGPGDFVFSGVISNNVDFYKVGAGTMIINGTNNDTTRWFFLNAGTITADFSAPSATVSNLLGNGGKGLNLGGGTLKLVGANGITNNQSFYNGGIVISPGNSAIALNSGAGGAVILNLQGINRATGSGIVDFTLPASGKITTTTATNSAGILGGWATVGGTDWAAETGTSPYAITNYIGYAVAVTGVAIASNVNTNIKLDNSSSGNIGLASPAAIINSLLVNDITARTITNNGATLRLGAAANGGIFLTAGSGGLTIGATANDGYLSAGGGVTNTAGELIFINNSAITVNSAMINNGNGALSVTVNGTGTVSFAGNNTYTGQTYVNSGATTFSGTNSLAAVNVRSGTLTFSATSSNTIGAVTVGGSGFMTTLNLNGQTSLGANSLVLGSLLGDRTLLVITTNAGMGKLYAGNATGASGAVIQNGGTVIIGPTTSGNDVLSVGNNGGYGYYQMNDGTLTAGQIAAAGNSANATGVFDMNGGTVNVSAAGGWLLAGGWQANSKGVFNLYGGTMTGPTGNPVTLNVFANMGAYGMINMLGSTAVLIATNNVNGINIMGGTGNSNGVVNLNAGTITAGRVYQGGAGSAQFNFNGGTLQAVANTNNPNFFALNTGGSACVYSGGGTIDTTNSTITISQNLIGPTGYGLSSVLLADNGVGYIGAPFVLITGGLGTGATAIAQMNLAGTVTNILITSPGFGYLPDDALVVQLLGGGFSNSAILGTVALAPNTNTGGLTKIGSGTLILTGTNTFGGGVTINSGTLSVGSDLNLGASGGLVAVAGGVLQVTGTMFTNLGAHIINEFTFNGGFDIVSNAAAFTVTNAIGGSGSLTKFGAGVLMLTGSNNYTGGTTVQGGILSADFGPSSSNITINGGTWGSPSGLITNALGTGAGQVNLFAGGFSAYNTPLTVNLGNGAALLWGSATFAPAYLLLNDSAANTNLTFQNNIDFNGVDRTITVNSIIRGAVATISGIITNGGLIKDGPGVLGLTGANVYNGNTLVQNGVLRAEWGTGLPNASALILTGGVWETASGIASNWGTGPGQFQLPGSTGGFSAVDSPLTVNIGGTGQTVLWSNGTPFNPSVLVLNAFSANTNLTVINLLDLNGGSRNIAVYAGTATLAAGLTNTFTTAAGGLIKTGPGILVISNQGTLNLQANPGFAINGGTVLLASGYIQSQSPANNADYIGQNAGDNGTLTLAGSSVLYRGNSSLTLGNNAASRGALVIQDTASYRTVWQTFVGGSGTGVVVMTGGTINNGNLFALGNNSGAVGAFYQSGGLVYVGNEFDAGYGQSGTYGFYQLTGGIFSNANWQQAARNGRGVLYFLGGTNVQTSVGNGIVAGNGNGIGVVYIAGCFVNNAGKLALGWTGTSRGEVTIDAGATVLLGTTGVQFNQNTGGTATGILNLNGGLLQAQTMFKQNSNGYSVVNFDGGTFRATTSQTILGTGAGAAGALDAAYIYGGGAFINSSNLNVTISQNLLAPTGYGVTNIVFTSLGGYVGAPQVAISGGGGTGATAVALFNYTTGSVTGIVVTSRGVGYTSTPTVTLIGGGNTNYNLNAQIGPNTSGGLTKLGTGMLTLTGTNTYSGPTWINAGTLTLGASALMTNTVRFELQSNAYLNVTAAGLTLRAQELKGSGTVLGSVTAGTGATITPGNSAGTLTVGNLTLTNGVKLVFELGPTNASDKVIVNNTLSLDGMNTNWFVLSAVGGFGAGEYTLFDATSIIGSLGSETNFADIGGYTGYLWLDTGANDVKLTVVPEPGTGTLVGAGLLAMFLLGRCRRERS